MADPIITPALIAAVVTIAVQVTNLGETIYGWFVEPEQMCNTKVNDDPEQWSQRPCLDVIEGKNDSNIKTTSN